MIIYTIVDGELFLCLFDTLVVTCELLFSGIVEHILTEGTIFLLLLLLLVVLLLLLKMVDDGTIKVLLVLVVLWLFSPFELVKFVLVEKLWLLPILLVDDLAPPIEWDDDDDVDNDEDIFGSDDDVDNPYSCTIRSNSSPLDGGKISLVSRNTVTGRLS